MNRAWPAALVCATETEARPFLDALHARALSGSPYPLYAVTTGARAPRCLLQLTGMGLAAAAEALEHLLAAHRPARVINCGVAGALSTRFAIGDVVRVTAVAEAGGVTAGRFRHLPAALLAGLSRTARRGRLLSVREPVFDRARRLRLSATGDLVDMEGAAIAAACARYGAAPVILKSVSDYADSRDVLRDNLAAGSRRLAEHVVDTLFRCLAMEIPDELSRPA